MYLSLLKIFAVLDCSGISFGSPLDLRSVKADYSGTKVFRLELYNERDVLIAKGIVSSLGLDTWTHSFAVDKNVDVVVPKSLLTTFNQKIENTSIAVSLMHDDLQESIHNESATLSTYDFSGM